MLYLDYSREPGEWVPNPHGGRENLEAVGFLRELNRWLHRVAPGVVRHRRGVDRVARGDHARSTTGGLGFGFKWNMGWMHDTLEYFPREPIHRRFHHHELTFAMVYAFSENFVLPLSHDEVVHGKRLAAREDARRPLAAARQPARAATPACGRTRARSCSSWAASSPRKREWDHERALDWELLDDPGHRGVQTLVRDLNHRYRAEPALWAGD